MEKKYIIEARDEQGQLDLKCEQPESVFGVGAIMGMTDWEMSRVIYARNKEVTLTGDNIPNWPKVLNPRWVARPKTW